MNESRLGLWLSGILLFIIAASCFGADEPCSLTRDNISPDEFDTDLSVVQVATHIKSASEDYLTKVGSKPFKDDVGKFISACDILSFEVSNMSASFAFSNEDFINQKNKKNKAITDASQSCLHGILYALNHEKKIVEADKKCSAGIAVIENDIASINKLKSINDKSIELVKKEVDPDEPIKNFTSEQLKVIEDNEDFSSIASEKPYYSMLEVGVSLMPEYDKDGNNKGFKESNFFGVLRLNNRMKDVFSFDNWVSYQGLEVAFYSAPIACVEDSTSDDSSAGDCKKPNQSVSDLKFRDISNTVNASVYLSVLYADPSTFGDWEFGPIVRSGVLNREKKGDDGDSVARFYNYGIELRLNDFSSLESGSKYQNGLPKFILNLAMGSNEDFAGTGIKTERQLASFNYRLFDNQPVFIGLIVDGGKGPDTIALNLSYGLKASNLFGLFTD